MNKKWCFLVLVIIIVLTTGCQSPVSRQEKDNITAFAYAYGLVRWFHPSDESQTIDWDQFALYGVKEVMECRSETELQQRLEVLFLPIAPGISFNNKDVAPDTTKWIPSDTTGFLPVTWQHYGAELGIQSNYYLSKRTNRPHVSKNINKLAIHGYFPAAEYKGHDIRMHIKIRIHPSNENFNVYPILTQVEGAPVFLCAENHNPLPGNNSWQNHEQRYTVDKKEGDIHWGIYTDGEGSLSIEEIVVFDETEQKAIRDLKFMDSNTFNSYDVRRNFLYEYTLNQHSLTITTKNIIFDRIPDMGSYDQRKIGKNLYMNTPVILYGTKDQTYPSGDKKALENLNEQLKNFIPTEKQKELADIVVAWNGIKYFSPYLSELPVDWDNELTNTLQMVIDSKEDSYNLRPFQLMMAKLEDGHVHIIDYNSDASGNHYPSYRLPFQSEMIRGQIIVTNPFDRVFKRGDIVLEINKENALKIYENYRSVISGSDQHKTAKANPNFHYAYKEGVLLDIKIDRDGKTHDCKVRALFIGDCPVNLREAQRWVNDSILYLNLGRIQFDEVAESIRKRKTNQTIIFDVRDYSAFLFRYIIPLLAEPGETLPENRDISIIPEIYLPQTPVVLDTLRPIEPPTPDRKNIFLINENDISNFEATLDYIRYAGLGYLVGNNTAGCCGMVNTIQLPGKRGVVFTGSKYLSNMGPNHYYYRTGIKPDCLVEPSIEQIKQGADAILEKAIEIAERN